MYYQELTADFNRCATSPYCLHMFKSLLFHVAVSKLPYSGHVSVLYNQIPGVCDDNNYFNRFLMISKATCRYLCDTALPREPCFGFTYYEIAPSMALQGTTVSKCIFLYSGCNPKIAKSLSTSVFTYIKQTGIAPQDGKQSKPKTNYEEHR